MKTNPTKFSLRSYGKSELAMLYSPGAAPQSALKTLNRWISGCTPLWSELTSMGSYYVHRHSFLKAEVAVIVKHLGEP